MLGWRWGWKNKRWYLRQSSSCNDSRGKDGSFLQFKQTAKLRVHEWYMWRVAHVMCHMCTAAQLKLFAWTSSQASVRVCTIAKAKRNVLHVFRQLCLHWWHNCSEQNYKSRPWLSVQLWILPHSRDSVLEGWSQVGSNVPGTHFFS